MNTPAHPFANRREAGRLLAARMRKYAAERNVIVLALPRGGVPIGFEVARALHAPLDLFIVRKLGVPGNPEYAMGALASGGIRVMNDEIVRRLEISDDEIDVVVGREQKELSRRENLYRGDRPPPVIHGRTVILVDDGLATGATMRAAIMALRQQQPERIVVGVPIAALETCEEFRDEVEEIICAVTPQRFYAVGYWYHDFSETTDEEVRDLLEQAARNYTPSPGAG